LALLLCKKRTGVYSFARYHESFYTTGTPPTEEDFDLTPRFLLMCLKVMTHECGHMFGMSHCIFFNCLMNGSNHLEESENRHSFLCPVCLRKLQFSIGFDVLKRYQDMKKFHEGLIEFFNNEGCGSQIKVGKINSVVELEWFKKRLDEIQSNDALKCT